MFSGSSALLMLSPEGFKEFLTWGGVPRVKDLLWKQKAFRSQVLTRGPKLPWDSVCAAFSLWFCRQMGGTLLFIGSHSLRDAILDLHCKILYPLSAACLSTFIFYCLLFLVSNPRTLASRFPVPRMLFLCSAPDCLLLIFQDSI